MSERANVRACAGAFLFLLMTSTASAQQWSMEAQAGRIRSTLDPNATASQTIVAGLRYEDDLTGFRISAGVPTQSAEPLWGSVAGSRRLQKEARGFTFGVDLAGNAFVLHDRSPQQQQQLPTLPGNRPPQTAPSLSGSAFAGQVLPLIGYDNLTVQATLRGGISQYTSNFSNNKLTRRVSLADAQVTYMPSMNVALLPNARFYHADEGDYSFAGVSAITVNGPVTLWGSAGTWLNRQNDNTTYAAGGSFRIVPNASVNVSARHDGIDPLYLSPPQNSWSAGVSVSFGKAAMAAPIPAKYDAGRATIRLTSNNPAPKIAGDFNNWKPQPMVKTGKDWTYSVALKPGVYNFAFVDAGGNWFVPEKYPGRKPDGMGGYVAVLVVQ